MRMEKKGIEFLIKQGEGYNLEFKEAFSESIANEKAGTGIKRMQEAMKEYMLELPEIETNRDWFTIVFKRPEESYEKRVYGSSQKSSQKILELAKESPEITIEELSDKLKISDRAVKKHIANLKKKGLLKRIGPDKGGYWEVVGRG